MDTILKIGPEFQVNTSTASTQTYSDITALSGGGFVVTWQDGDYNDTYGISVPGSGTLGDSDGSSLKAQIFDASRNPVGPEFLVNSNTTSNQLRPSVSALSGGGFVVVWTDASGNLGDGDRTGIAAQIFNARGAMVGAEFLVNTRTRFAQSEPAVAGLANGGFAVVWNDGDIEAQLFDAAGQKVGSQFSVDGAVTGQYAPTITALSNGGFVVAWEDWTGTLDNSGGGIVARLYDATGAAVGATFRINSETRGSQQIPTIAALTNGGFAVAWVDSSGILGDSDTTSINARVFGADGTAVGPGFLVNTRTASLQSFPSIGALASGGFVVTWTDWSGTLGDSSLTSIKAQLYDASGNRVGTEFLVNTATAEDQQFPAVVGLPNGDFVVTWSDTSRVYATFEGSEIKAQLFRPAGAVNVSIGDATISEGRTGTRQMIFTVTRSDGTGAFDVAFVTADGTARSADGDYVPLSGSVHFADGATSQTIAITIPGDARLENDETFTVDLSGATGGAVITDGQGLGTIRNDDSAVWRNHDFVGDGTADVLWRNGAGVTYLWSMNGETVADGMTTSIQVGSIWRIDAVADFDGDGSADILWTYHNAADPNDGMNGVTYLSLQHGSNASAGSGVVQQLSEDWQLVGAADFSGDGKADLLYRNAVTGRTYIDVMNGAEINWNASGFTTATVSDPAWSVAAVADFDGDGRADILWRHGSGTGAADPLDGALYEWTMNGTTVVGQGAPTLQPGAAWEVAGTGDFDGDGRADLLFRHNDATNPANALNGMTYVGFMNGTTVTSGALTSWQVGQDWSLASVGDFDADGRADILWRQEATGATYLWRMDGANVTAGAFTSSQVGTDWHVQNVV